MTSAFWEVQLRHTDVAIVGGGLAGSLAAAMLGRAGIDAVLIDPHPVYPPDFRCEKLDEVQLETLRLTGLAGEVLSASTPYRESWTARFGHVVEKRLATACGILYDTLVNTVRGQFPATPVLSTPRSRPCRPGRSARSSDCRTATPFRRGWSCWRRASTSGSAPSSASITR